jgi:ABC-type sugar transport system, permease component
MSEGIKSNRMKTQKAAHFNRVKPMTNAMITVLFIVLALVAILPFVFVVIISFSSEASVINTGYSFVPSEWSLDTYRFLWQTREDILRSFANSVGVTVAGTVLGLALISSFGYAISRPNYRFKRFSTVFIFIPMLFQGGLVSTYMINTQLFQLKDSYLGLILPLACSTWYIIIMRTFFATTIPDSVIESAKIDGATQWRIFRQIVLPISLPAFATIGLFLTFAYWNDWYQAMLYISNRKLFPLQYLLVSIERAVDFLAKSEDSMLSAASLPSETIRMAIVVIAVLPIACSYPFFQKYFISGLTIGAVKG